MVRRRRKQRRVSLETILRLAERIGLEDRTVQKLLRTAIRTDSNSVRKRIEKRLTALVARQEIQPFGGQPPSIAPDEQRIHLGTTITGSDFDLPQDVLTQHLLAVGKSGAGKTTMLYNIMQQLTVPFWAFDLKQDHRHLIEEDTDLLVLPWSELKFNPLRPPPEIRPRRWAQVFGEVFGHATALLSGSKNYLMKQIVKLYQLYGLLDEISPPYPSLLELQVLVQRDKINYVRKQANYRDTVQNRLSAMNRTAGSIFNCSEGYPITDLLDCDVVFEFDGIGEDTQNFLMEILIAYVFEYRLATNQRGGELRHVFVMDEGKRVFSRYKERQDAAGLPKIDEFTAKLREFGEGLIVADQEASKLTDSIKANTDTKILLSMRDAKQFGKMASSMFLSERQQELAKKVSVGEAVIQTGNRDPVPVKLERYNVDKAVSDELLKERQQWKWEELSSTPREMVPEFEDAVGFESENAVEMASSVESQLDVELSDAAEKLLRDIVTDEFKPLTERYDIFDNRKQGIAAKQELVEKGIVQEHNLTGTRTGGLKLLAFTEGGRAYVEMRDELDLKQRGRGGIVHRYWQHRIKDLFEEAGWSAKVEMFDADVYAELDGTELAIEVALGKNEREIEHVQKHLEAFDAVWIAFPTEDVRGWVREHLEDRGLMDGVTLRMLSDFQDPDGLPNDEISNL